MSITTIMMRMRKSTSTTTIMRKRKKSPESMRMATAFIIPTTIRNSTEGTIITTTITIITGMTRMKCSAAGEWKLLPGLQRMRSEAS